MYHHYRQRRSKQILLTFTPRGLGLKKVASTKALPADVGMCCVAVNVKSE